MNPYDGMLFQCEYCGRKSYAVESNECPGCGAVLPGVPMPVKAPAFMVSVCPSTAGTYFKPEATHVTRWTEKE